jgi:hypothetical protein
MTVVVVSAMVLSLLLVSSGKTGAHTGDWIDSAWTTSPPTIDGSMTAGEWSDAASADLGAIPGNAFLAYLLVKNDANFLYIAYDAVGDATVDSMDEAAVSFDTGHDVTTTVGGESEFSWGPGANNGQAHLVFDGSGWSTEDSPFDTGLPNHAGLASAFGYGPSDLNALDHRIYELQIPLALLDAVPTDVIGFLGASEPSPGVWDAGTGYDCWPAALTGPPSLVDYGDLRIGRAPMAADLDMNPPSQVGQALPSSSADYTITVVNRGTANDIFEMQVMSVWVTDLFDSGGVNPLVDSDGDLIPDTGSLGPGANVQIIARVNTPASGTCDDALITGTSSNDPLTSSTAVVSTCLTGAGLNPPHADSGIDTDLPANGLYDELQIDVGVMVGTDGFYDVAIDLYDPSDVFFITSGSNYNYLSTGPQVVSVFLQGATIYDSGFDGQYVAYIYLYDDFGNTLDIGMYVTASYMHTDFDGPDALLNPPHSDFGMDTDSPPNSLYDELWINVGVMVSVDGYYEVDVALYDPSDIFYITSAVNYSYLPTGPQSVSVILQGLDIYDSGYDGQYVAYIYLYDDFGNPLDNGIYVTSSYAHTDFDGPGALFNPPHSDHGIDTDVPPNGLYDELVIDVGVTVTEAGTYAISGPLFDQFMNFIAFNNTVVDLAIGNQVVPLAFSGLQIFLSGLDGPYTTSLALSDLNVTLDSNTYTTGVYSCTDFDTLPGRFEPPHNDRGLDLTVPADGLYEFLELAIIVNVSEAASFEIDVELYDSTGMNYILSTNVIEDLDFGLQTVPVRLDGLTIRNSGFDGPYEADLYLISDSITIDVDIYVTQAYLHSDFSPEGAAFTPPYSDWTVDYDVPPDGKADLLLVEVNIDVMIDGPYSVMAMLVASGSIFIEFTEVRQTLTIGVSPVTIPFDGHKIADSGADGPYMVEMLLYDEYHRLIDMDIYITTAYASDQFELPDLTAPISTVGAMSYWKNGIPLLVPYAAADSSPTDGLESVTLYYQYSADNSSWSSWTEYSSAFTGSNPSAGIMPFTFPDGAGYYRFQMISIDAAGNQESLGAPEAEVAYLPLAEVRFQPDPLPLSAGQQRTLTVSILSTNGQPAMLESSQTVNLDTWSPSGEYRAVSGSTPITSVTIQAGSSSASVDYYDAAAGTWTLLGYTSGGIGGMGEAIVIAGSVASITVEPGAIAIEVTQAQTFTAIAKDAYGNSVSSAIITWDVGSSLGTVDATGRFTAGTLARSGTITARSDSIQGSADIILTPGPAAGIEVTPDSATIQSGTEVTIIAEVVDAYGNVINAASVAWTVSGPGTVSPGSGATTTVTANGAGAISVTATLGSLSATATFTSVDTGGGLSSMAIAGIAGSLIGGILIGFAVGWILHKRRTKPQQPAQMQVPPPPPVNFPPAQPPLPPQGT